MRGSDVGEKGFCSELSLQELSGGSGEPTLPLPPGACLWLAWETAHVCLGLGQVVRGITYNPGPIVLWMLPEAGRLPGGGGA